MNHIKNLQKYAKLLVIGNGTYDELSDCYILAWDDLELDERMELCRLYIECKDRDVDFIVDGIRNGDMTIDSEFNCRLLEILAENKLSDRDSLVDTIINNLLNYTAADLQDILDNACDDYQQELKENKGFDE